MIRKLGSNLQASADTDAVELEPVPVSRCLYSIPMPMHYLAATVLLQLSLCELFLRGMLLYCVRQSMRYHRLFGCTELTWFGVVW